MICRKNISSTWGNYEALREKLHVRKIKKLKQEASIYDKLGEYGLNHMKTRIGTIITRGTGHAFMAVCKSKRNNRFM